MRSSPTVLFAEPPQQATPGAAARPYMRATHTLLMSIEELKQVFESARIKHVHFKTRLRSHLFGNGGGEGPLRDPEQSGLGQWVAGRLRGTGPYAHLPEARQFDREHVRIHQAANRLMDLRAAGHGEEALAGFAAVQAIADGMVVLLQTMQAELRTEAGTARTGASAA